MSDCAAAGKPDHYEGDLNLSIMKYYMDGLIEVFVYAHRQAGTNKYM